MNFLLHLREALDQYASLFIKTFALLSRRRIGSRGILAITIFEHDASLLIKHRRSVVATSNPLLVLNLVLEGHQFFHRYSGAVIGFKRPILCLEELFHPDSFRAHIWAEKALFFLRLALLLAVNQQLEAVLFLVARHYLALIKIESDPSGT